MEMTPAEDALLYTYRVASPDDREIIDFQTRFDSPKVETAVSARAVLFRCPPIPLPCFFVLLPVSSIKIVTFSLWHSGQIIYVPSLSFYDIYLAICKGGMHYAKLDDRAIIRIKTGSISKRRVASIAISDIQIPPSLVDISSISDVRRLRRSPPFRLLWLIAWG